MQRLCLCLSIAILVCVFFYQISAQPCQDVVANCRIAECSLRPGYAMTRCAATCGKCGNNGLWCVDSRFYPCDKMIRYRKSCHKRLQDLCPVMCGICSKMKWTHENKKPLTVSDRVFRHRPQGRASHQQNRRTRHLKTQNFVAKSTPTGSPAVVDVTAKPEELVKLKRNFGIFSPGARLPVYYDLLKRIDDDNNARKTRELYSNAEGAVQLSQPTSPYAVRSSHLVSHGVLIAAKLLGCRDGDHAICGSISFDDCLNKPGYYLSVCPLTCKNCLGLICLDSVKLNCSKVAEMGLCEKRVDLAVNYCPLSCGYCPKMKLQYGKEIGNEREHTACDDLLPNCVQLAKADMCHHPFSSDTMTRFCRKACQLCEEDY